MLDDRTRGCQSIGVQEAFHDVPESDQRDLQRIDNFEHSFHSLFAETRDGIGGSTA